MTLCSTTESNHSMKDSTVAFFLSSSFSSWKTVIESSRTKTEKKTTVIEILICIRATEAAAGCFFNAVKKKKRSDENSCFLLERDKWMNHLILPFIKNLIWLCSCSEMIHPSGGQVMEAAGFEGYSRPPPPQQCFPAPPGRSWGIPRPDCM